jgi:cellulose synthase/poly-beta-1,6-N-acetylglucosamine synthase-like glycosyltransferase
MNSPASIAVQPMGYPRWTGEVGKDKLPSGTRGGDVAPITPTPGGVAIWESTQGRPPTEWRSITVIFPAYNEEANIGRAIERSIEAMSPHFDTFELLIIDDGSRDNTGSIAEGLAKTYPEVNVLHNKRNMVLGETLYRGFQCAKGELVIQNAMDYPLDLRDLDKMLPLLVPCLRD